MRFAFPITKFEKQADGSLKVVGLATDETLDSQGDILDYAGSKAAFGAWRGNVREAHDPKKPVGKALKVNFDDEKKAIEVEAFISSGAPETIQKIQDGVLQSFSVGGSNPTKAKAEKVGDKIARRVLEWEMTELSVVDVGANPNANIQLVKADGVATDELASDAELAVAANRFAAALLNEITKGKKKVRPAESVAEDAARNENHGATESDALHHEAMAGGTGTGPSSMPGVRAPGANVPDPLAGKQPGDGGGVPGAKPTAQVEGTHSIPDSVPISYPDAAGAVPKNVGTTPAPQSAAPKPAAEAVEETKSGKEDAEQSAAPKAAAEDVEEEKAGDEPAPASDGIEQVAEAGGSDTEEDMIDGKKKRSPKGTDASVPTTGKATEPDIVKAAKCDKCMKVHKDGVEACQKEDIAAVGKDDIAAASSAAMKKRKAAVRALVTKYLWGGEENDIADAASLLGRVRDLYASEAAEGEDESAQLDLLATALGALQRFIALEADELENPEGIPPDQSASKDEGGMALDEGGMAMAAVPQFSKALMPLVMKAMAKKIAEKFVPADVPGVFKVNHGDQMAEGIGKGLSVVSDGIQKAQAEFKGYLEGKVLIGEAEFKGMREEIVALSKTAAVPMPLRTVPSVSAEHSPTTVFDVLEAAGNGITDPEMRAKWAQQVAIAKSLRK